MSEGFFGEVPESIHEKAVHLMRLLVTGYVALGVAAYGLLRRAVPRIGIGE